MLVCFTWINTNLYYFAFILQNDGPEPGPDPEPEPPEESLENHCPEGDSEISFQEHPTSCTKYIICLDGESVLQECAPTLIFDPELLTCIIADDDFVCSHD
jgi:hypothetical protein